MNPSGKHPKRIVRDRQGKLFPFSTTFETKDHCVGAMPDEVRSSAAVCQPGQGEAVGVGPVTVRAYASAGGGRFVGRVDLSVDKGRTRTQTKPREGADGSWSWSFWEATPELGSGQHRSVARALNVPAAEVWDPKGYANSQLGVGVVAR